MTTSFFLPRPRIIDDNGKPISGARVTFFEAGTTTPKNVYYDQGNTTPISQPVLADAGGKLPMIYFDTGLYKIRIEDSSSALLDETDNVDPGLGAVAAALPISAGGTGGTTAAAARANLSVPSQAEMDALADSFSELESDVNQAVSDVTLTTGTPPPLGLSVVVMSDTAVQVTADEVVVAGAGGLRRLTAVSVSADITVLGANGRDAGTEEANRWYYVFVIYNPSTTTSGAIISTSPGGPILPSGYTYYRRVGAIRNNASSNLYRTRQVSNVASYTYGVNPSSGIVLISGNNSGTNKSVVDVIPSTAIAIRASAYIAGGTAGASGSIGDTSSFIEVFFESTDNDGDKTATIPFTIYLSGTTIYYKAVSNPGANVTVSGWIDSI